MREVGYGRVSFTVFDQIDSYQCHVGIGQGFLLVHVHTRVGKDEFSFDGGSGRCIVDQHGFALDEEPGPAGVHRLVQLFRIGDITEGFFIESVGIERLFLALLFGLLQDTEQILVVALEVAYQPVERDKRTFLPVFIGYDRYFSFGNGRCVFVDRCARMHLAFVVRDIIRGLEALRRSFHIAFEAGHILISVKSFGFGGSFLFAIPFRYLDLERITPYVERDFAQVDGSRGEIDHGFYRLLSLFFKRFIVRRVEFEVEKLVQIAVRTELNRSYPCVFVNKSSIGIGVDRRFERTVVVDFDGYAVAVVVRRRHHGIHRRRLSRFRIDQARVSRQRSRGGGQRELFGIVLEEVREFPFYRIFHQIGHILEFHIGKLALARRGQRFGLPLHVDDGGESVGCGYAPQSGYMQHVGASVDKRQVFFGLLVRIAVPHLFFPYDALRAGFADLQMVHDAFAGLGPAFGQQTALVFPAQVEVAGVVHRDGIGRYIDRCPRGGGKGRLAEVGRLRRVALFASASFRVGGGIGSAQRVGIQGVTLERVSRSALRDVERKPFDVLVAVTASGYENLQPFFGHDGRRFFRRLGIYGRLYFDRFALLEGKHGRLAVAVVLKRDARNHCDRTQFVSDSPDYPRVCFAFLKRGIGRGIEIRRHAPDGGLEERRIRAVAQHVAVVGVKIVQLDDLDGVLRCGGRARRHRPRKLHGLFLFGRQFAAVVRQDDLRRFERALHRRSDHKRRTARLTEQPSHLGVVEFEAESVAAFGQALAQHLLARNALIVHRFFEDVAQFVVC